MTSVFDLQHLPLGVASLNKHPLQSRRVHSPPQLRFLRDTNSRNTKMRSGLVVAHAARCTASFYDVLELSPNVGLSDIKRAYRQLARRYHPDVCPSNRAEESTRRFIEIQEAYEVLSDPPRRAVYDHAVAMGRGSAANGRMPWSPSNTDCQMADWKLQWENQLLEFRRQSFMGERRMDSWAARVRRQNGR